MSLLSQNCPLNAQTRPLITAISRGKCRYRKYIIDLIGCFHSLHSFKPDGRGATLRFCELRFSPLVEERAKENKGNHAPRQNLSDNHNQEEVTDD